MTEDEIRRACRDKLQVIVDNSPTTQGVIQCVFIDSKGMLHCVIELAHGIFCLAGPRNITIVGKKCPRCGSSKIKTREGYDLFRDKSMTQKHCLECNLVFGEGEAEGSK